MATRSTVNGSMIHGPKARMRAALLAGLLIAAPQAARGDRAATVRELRARLAEAALAVDQERLDDAARIYAGAVEQARSLGETNLLLARAADGLADVHRRAGRNADAERMYELALGIWERLLGPDQPRLATTLHNLGAVHLAQGRPDDAVARFCQALDIFEKALGPDSPEATNSRRGCEATAR